MNAGYLAPPHTPAIAAPMSRHLEEHPGPAARLARGESWLPLAIGATWWLAMYPGLYGEDSLMNLAEARSGPVSVWFTAWWIYVIRFVSVGVRVIPLLSLLGVLTLTFAIREWARACFPETRERALALYVMCATPLVGALGIQVRHDIPMTAGLLLFVAVMTRSIIRGGELRAADYVQLVAAVLLIATRHNGLPTILGAAFCGVALAGAESRRRWMSAALGVALGIFIVTQAATRLSGNPQSIDPVQTVEWALADISCLLTTDHVHVSADDWKVLGGMASPSDWPNPAACRFMNNRLFHAQSLGPSAISEHRADLLGVWLSLAGENPLSMLRVHAQRVRLFLPPLMTGIRTGDQTPFIHSTILPNDFGLRWLFPRVAGTVRVVVRAWNAARIVLANAGIWLAALAIVAWRSGDRGHVHLLPTLLVAVSLELGLLATAPISEGRYGLFILICGQTAALVASLEMLKRRQTHDRSDHSHHAIQTRSAQPTVSGRL